MSNRSIFPEIDRWLRGMTTEQVAQVHALPVRRDMVTLLGYLRDNRIIGTQSTGNLPLKAVCEVTAQFVNPPQLDTTIGEHTYRLRTEYDVWPLYFLHGLANVGGLLSGGQARRLRLTSQGDEFLNTIPPVQVWYMLTTWWWQINWLIAYPVVGMGERLPPSFEEVVLEHLLALPVNNRLSYAGFADALMQNTGLRWSKPELPDARDFMHSGIQKILMNILSRFEVVELHFRDEKIYKHTYQKLDAFEVTPFGRGLLQAVEVAK